MRPQDDQSQQSSLSLCDQDSGIRQSRQEIPHSNCSLQKRSTPVLSETLAKPHHAGETYKRRVKVVALASISLPEARIRIDRGIVGCGEHTEISNTIQGLRRYDFVYSSTEIFAQHYPEDLRGLNTFDALDGLRRYKS